MGLGDSTNTGYKPDWRYDMTGGGVKKKTEETNALDKASEESFSDSSYEPDWPYDMTGGKSKSHKKDLSDVANESAEAADNSDYEPDWPYDMTGGRSKNHKKEAEAEEAAPEVTAAEEPAETAIEKPETKIEPAKFTPAEAKSSDNSYWPYDMSGGKGKNKTGAASGSGKGADAPWPYDMSSGSPKSHKKITEEAVSEPQEETEAPVAEEKQEVTIEPAKFTPAEKKSSDNGYWPYDMTGGAGKSKAAASSASSKSADAPWPYDMSSGTPKNHKKAAVEAAPEPVPEAEAATPAEEKQETKIEPAKFTPAEKKSSDNGYWPYDMTAGTGKSKAAAPSAASGSAKSADAPWPYDMSSGTPKSHKKAAEEPAPEAAAEEEAEAATDIPVAEEKQETKIEPAKLTPAEKKSSDSGYWPYDMSAGNKNKAAKDPDYWPYDMSGSSTKDKSKSATPAAGAETGNAKADEEAGTASAAGTSEKSDGGNTAADKSGAKKAEEKEAKKANKEKVKSEPKERKVNNNHYDSDGVGFLKWLRRKSQL